MTQVGSKAESYATLYNMPLPQDGMSPLDKGLRLG